jgi:hypothetical protein
VGRLFEKFEGREAELRKSLRKVFAGLQTGEIGIAPQHNPNDATACIPLIDDCVVVIQPLDNWVIITPMSGEALINIAKTKTIGLLTIEQEPR